MGLFSKFKRDYHNAGVNIFLSFHVVENLDSREKIDMPWFSCQCTGLELHGYANKARKDFLRILNETPYSAHKHLKIPNDFWKLAARVIIPIYDTNRNEIPVDQYSIARDTISLIAESAFDTFEMDDAVSVHILKNADVWVERLRLRPLSFDKTLLGNINEQSAKP